MKDGGRFIITTEFSHEGVDVGDGGVEEGLEDEVLR